MGSRPLPRAPGPPNRTAVPGIVATMTLHRSRARSGTRGEDSSENKVGASPEEMGLTIRLL